MSDTGHAASDRSAAPPNLLLIVTDQQRYPMHWPDDSDWLRELMPADAELARTGLTFERAFTNTCMCSPSRSTLLTGLYPAQHGVTLTLTHGGASPDPRNIPGTLGVLAEGLRRPAAARRSYLRAYVRGATQRAANPDEEPLLPPNILNMARMLKGAGYSIAYKGKWHLTKPLREDTWTGEDARHISERYDFDRWDPPDAGEDVLPEHFGGGNAGFSGLGWDEEYTRQALAFLANPPSEPFALIVSLVNPHDVLAYPRSFETGGYTVGEFRDFGVELPETYNELQAGKPTVHALMKMGQAAFIGSIASRRAALDYVNFYAYLHRLVDGKIARILGALGDPGDPRSLRARTMIVRTADHGEMGLSHGGLRQKMFNTYEETIHIPLVVSNPVLFPQARTTDAFASLIDLMPTLASVCNADGGDDLRGLDLTPVLAGEANAQREAVERGGVDFSAVLNASPESSVQAAVHFTYDDHKAATSRTDSAPPPNHIRCVRTGRHKFAVYFDPQGRAEPQYEMYDLERDPLERHNLVDVASGAALFQADAAACSELGELLDDTLRRCGTGAGITA